MPCKIVSQHCCYSIIYMFLSSSDINIGEWSRSISLITLNMLEPLEELLLPHGYLIKLELFLSFHSRSSILSISISLIKSRRKILMKLRVMFNLKSIIFSMKLNSFKKNLIIKSQTNSKPESSDHIFNLILIIIFFTL